MILWVVLTVCKCSPHPYVAVPHTTTHLPKPHMVSIYGRCTPCVRHHLKPRCTLHTTTPPTPPMPQPINETSVTQNTTNPITGLGRQQRKIFSQTIHHTHSQASMHETTRTHDDSQSHNTRGSTHIEHHHAPYQPSYTPRQRAGCADLEADEDVVEAAAHTTDGHGTTGHHAARSTAPGAL